MLINIVALPSTVVAVGLQPVTTSVGENETFQVCASLSNGSLERDVYIGIAAENSSTAIRTYIQWNYGLFINVLHSLS